MLWGPRDPVFSDRYLRDLRARLPHAHVHRYERASHLVTEDAPESAVDAWRWLQSRDEGPPPRAPRPADRPPVWAALEARAGDPGRRRGRARGRPAASSRSTCWSGGCASSPRVSPPPGVRAGERVALLVPPGADLTAATYACWRAGAVVVLADAGLGPVGLARALRGAAPDHVIGVARGLALARLLGIPGRRILAGAASRALRRLLGSPPGPGRHRPHRPRVGPRRQPVDPDAAAAVLFTSGATGAREGRGLPPPPAAGPARHPAHRLRDHPRRPARGGVPAVRALRGRPGHRLRPRPAPAPRSTSPRPPSRPPPRPWRPPSSSPRPAALRGVVATVDGLGPDPPRGAGPDPPGRLRRGRRCPRRCCTPLGDVLPRAAFHTPYGMTEALPVTDVSLAEIDAAGSGDGRLRRAAAARRRRADQPAVGRRDGRRPADRRERGDRRGLRPRGPRQGPLRPALGHRARHVARRGVAPHRRRRATSTTRGCCGSRAAPPT
jgi:hypothetical protein